MRELLAGLLRPGLEPDFSGHFRRPVSVGHGPAAARNLGAHYTREKNILKLIRPLFLDELRAEFERIKNQQKKLVSFISASPG